MKFSKKHLQKLVTFDPEGLGEFFFSHEYHVISVEAPNWLELTDMEVADPLECQKYIKMVNPTPVLGMVIELAVPVANVSINYAKVLFPEMAYDDPDNEFLAHPIHMVIPAGAYWVNGDIMMLVENQ